jgi:transcriptional antiterminator Rof (Rho-off)
VRHPRRDDLKKFFNEIGAGCALHYPLPLHLKNAERISATSRRFHRRRKTPFSLARLLAFPVFLRM